jgi:cell division protein FtsQ
VIEQELINHPWVEAVALRLVWPSRLEVTFKEPMPLMRWGEGALVTASGYVFTPGEHIMPRYAHLPSIELDTDPWQAGYERFMKLSKVVESLDQKLMSLHQNAQLGWILKTEKGLTVYFGNKDFDTRLERWVEAWKQLGAELKDSAKRVDLRYSNGLAIGQ